MNVIRFNYSDEHDDDDDDYNDDHYDDGKDGVDEYQEVTMIIKMMINS